MGRCWIICVGLVGLVCGASPATAVAAGATLVTVSEPAAVEAGFRLNGSHGYSISVIAFSEGEDHGGTIDFTASRHGASVFYSAPASVTTDAIHADLGGIGKVDVVRHPSGLEKTVHLKCLGGSQTYEPGIYEGVIEFNGEEGYTRAREDRVAQLPAWLVFAAHGACGSGSGESSGPGEPGARLRGASFEHGRALSFQVNKNSPKARTVFTASLKERRGGIRIDRRLSGEASPSAFRFDQNLRTATLSPRAPFSGSASVSRSKDSFPPIWKGDLKLAFPGRSVPLAGSGIHVSLVHARFTRSRGPKAEIGT
jgi:hypothetical protein